MVNGPAGAQPTPNTERAAEIAAGAKAAAAERRDKFVIAFGSAIVGAKPNGTPGSVAKAVVKWVDEFLAALDTPTGN